MLCKFLFVFHPGRKRLVVAASIMFLATLAVSPKPPFIEQSEAKATASPQVTVSLADFDPATFSMSEFAD